jgi:hypothetical protein
MKSKLFLNGKLPAVMGAAAGASGNMYFNRQDPFTENLRDLNSRSTTSTVGDSTPDVSAQLKVPKRKYRLRTVSSFVPQRRLQAPSCENLMGNGGRGWNSWSNTIMKMEAALFLTGLPPTQNWLDGCERKEASSKISEMANHHTWHKSAWQLWTSLTLRGLCARK